MASNGTSLSAEAFAELQEELQWREGDLAQELAASIQDARSQGDISENAEFDAAVEEQQKNVNRIAEIRRLINKAVLEDSSTKTKGTVSIGSTVDVEDEKGNKHTFTIVSTTQTNSLEGAISNESPIGHALTDAKKGDKVSYETPSGKKRTLKVLKVTR